MNLDELTMGQVKEIKAMVGGSGGKSSNLIHAYLGKTVLIHGAIYHYSGKVLAIDDDFVKLGEGVMVFNSDVDKPGEFEKFKEIKRGGGVLLIGREMIEAIFESN